MYMRGHWQWYLMNMKVILKHYFKIIMKFVTTIETSRHSWSKSLRLKYFLLLRSQDPSLKGEIILTTLQIFQKIETEGKRTLYFGLETISYRSPQLWSLLPEHMGQLNSIDQFKRSVRRVHTECVKYIYRMSGFCKYSMKSLTWKGI